MLNGLMTDLPVVCLFQNLVLPECFYTFVDVRKEFHKCCPNAGQVQDLTLPYILECKSESDQIVISVNTFDVPSTYINDW